MNYLQLIEQLKSGQQPVVEFREGIYDTESYAEPNMRARVIGYRESKHDEEIARIEFDFAEFEGHNRPFESTNYYDKDGKPTLKAREAGYYHPQEVLYFSPDDDVARSMVILEDARQALFNMYKDSGVTVSYTAWLEDQVIANHRASRM